MSKNIKDQLKQLNIIYFALMVGQIMMCTILLLLKGGEEATSTFIYIGPIISIATIFAVFSIYKTQKEQARKLTSEDEKLEHHRLSNIRRWALLEMGNFINIGFFFMEGNYIYLMFFALGMIVFALFRPTERALKEEYRI